MITRKSNPVFILLFAVVSFLVSLNASAATRTWTGAGGDALWSTPSNWTPNIVPTLSDTIVFPSGKTGGVYNDLLSSVRVITFDGTGYHVAGDAISVTLKIESNATSGTNYIDVPVTTTADATFSTASGGTLNLGLIDTFGHKATFNGAGTINVAGVISGSGSIATTGTPTLKLNVANSFTGASSLGGGSVVFGASNALPAASAVTATDVAFNLNSFAWKPASLTMTGCTLTGTGTGLLTLPTVAVMTSSATQPTTLGAHVAMANPGTQVHVTDGPATDDVVFTASMTGGYLQKTGAGRLSLTANNSLVPVWDGKLYVEDGAVAVKNDNALGSSTGTTEVTNWGVLELSGFVQNESVSFNCFAGAGGVRSIGNATWGGPVTLTGDVNVFLQNNGSITFMQSLTGAGKIAQVTGAGTLDLEATSTMSATIPVDGSRLLINGSLPNASISSTSSAATIVTGSGSFGGSLNMQLGTLTPGGGPDLTLGTGSLVLRGKLSFPYGLTVSSAVVTGTVDITGATLEFLASNTPDATVTLIDNDGSDAVIGTFAGLPEGSLVNVDGRSFRISYVGGTGNDIVLTPVSTFHIVDTVPSVNENGNSVTVSVTRNSSVAGAVSVQFATSNNTATAGSDFTTTNRTLAWGNGESGTKTITIPILNDNSVEADETFTVALGNAIGGTIDGADFATVTIRDEDSIIYFSDTSYTISEAAGSVQFHVKRDAGSAAPPSSVDFSTADGTATAGSDYNAESQTVSWNTGESFVQNINVFLIPDYELESSETFKASLTNAQGSPLGATSATATLTDDDFTFKWSADPYSVSETAGKVTIAVERVGSNSAPASIKYVTSNTGATAGVDYAASTGTLSWAAGDGAPKTIDITIFDDTSLEGDESFDVNLQPVMQHGVIDDLSTRVNILDNENGVEFVDTTVNTTESAGTVTLNVRRTGSHGSMTVAYAAQNGTATNGSDYTLQSGALSWNDGETGDKSITIPIIDDGNAESAESFQVILSNPTSATLLSKTSATIAINDDDFAGQIQFATNDYTVSEDSGTAIVVVKRVNGAAGPASADYSTSDGLALAGSDYVAKSGTLTWAAGDSSDRTIAITIGNDSVVEQNENFHVNLTNVTGAAAGTPSMTTIAILNDDVTPDGNAQNPGVLALSGSTITVNEDESIATITVMRSGGSDGPATVHYATVAGTAIAGTDFSATSGTIAWAAGDDAPKSFTVAILDDFVTESAEAFSVSLSAATGAALGTPATATINITDNDVNGILALSSDNVSVGESGGSVMLFVARTGGSAGAATVHYATSNGTAIAGSDYTATSGTLTWANGDANAKQINIPILDDSTYEPSESFTVTLSNATGATMGTTTSATITIGDDESAPAGTLQFSSATYSVNENAGTVLITVNRTGGAGGAASVTYNTASGSAAVNADFTPVVGGVSWQDGDSSPKTFTVPIVNDSLAEGAETFTVSLLNVSGAAIGNPGTATITIEPNDTSTSTTLLSSINPAVFGGTITFTATVSPNVATGTISLMEGSTEIASKALSNGTATLNVSVLGLGSHSLTAVYNGDSLYGGSTSAPLVQVISGAVKSDLNHDGRSDIVLQNMNTSSVAAWLMDNKTLMEGKVVASPTAEWQVVATGDLNGDGKADIIVKNKTTGAIVLWRMNGTARTSEATIATPASIAWRVVAARDFSHDGKDDLILQNADSGVVALWTMNDATIMKGTTLGTPAVTTRAVAVGNFGGDAVILQDDVTRTITRWIVNGTTVTSTQTIATPAAGWQVVATGDMDGDGNDDIAVQNSGTRTVAAWLLDATGSVLTKTGIVATPVADWKVVGGGDYNADGRLDLLLFNTITNGIAQWQMNGVVIGGGWNIGTLPGWKPLGN